MGNLFCTTAKIDRRFDLKGSTYGRLTPQGYNPETKILKDLDLDYQLELEDGLYEKLMHQIKVDCQLLERCNIMDYSLLLGMSFRSKASQALLSAAEGGAGGGLGGAAPGAKKRGGSSTGGAKNVGFDPAASAGDAEMAKLALEAADKLPKLPRGGLDRTLSSVRICEPLPHSQMHSGRIPGTPFFSCLHAVNALPVSAVSFRVLLPRTKLAWALATSPLSHTLAAYRPPPPSLRLTTPAQVLKAKGGAAVSGAGGGRMQVVSGDLSDTKGADDDDDDEDDLSPEQSAGPAGWDSWGALLGRTECVRLNCVCGITAHAPSLRSSPHRPSP